MTPERPRGCTTGEAARLLGVSPATVRHWIAQGKFASAVAVTGAGYLLDRAAVERLAAARATRRWGEDDGPGGSEPPPGR